MPDHLASGDVGTRRNDVAEPTIPGSAGGSAEGGEQVLRRSSVVIDQVFSLMDHGLVETGTPAS
jgi:hypothetical protein